MNADYLNYQRSAFQFGQEKARAPWELQELQTRVGLDQLGFQRQRAEFGEYQAGAGLRGLERQYGLGKTEFDLQKLQQEKSQYGLNLPIVTRQAEIQRQQADLASRMFNPATYADTLRRQQEMERQKMAMENSAMMLRKKQMQEMGSRFGLGTNPEFLRGLGISPTESLQPSWSSNYRVPVFPA